jgi:malate dehydrogenase (oxaloacetate-decarboxylating)
MQAVAEGLARITLTREEAFAQAAHDITQARAMVEQLIAAEFIAQPPQSMLQEALDWAIEQV